MEGNERMICPWCSTEIVWDPECGAEDHCPHCEMELTDYRSLHVNEYEEFKIERLLREQEEGWECVNCHEWMLYIGDLTVTAERFVPAVRHGMEKPLIAAPFTIKKFVCPSCGRLDEMLEDEAKFRLFDRLSQME